jgi:FAD/FMN-containing dehydrogenase
MRATHLDAASQTAHAQGGAQLRDVDAATLPFGRSVPLGVFSETGIGGLTLSGGYGWQSRARGLSCDNLLAASVVTADGTVREVSATENADLFWALRGGGTQLGVVTAFQYRTHPMPPAVFMLFATYPLAAARDVLRQIREYAASASNEVGLIAVIWTFQPSDAIPRELWNEPFIGVIGTYLGTADQGQRVLTPLRHLGRSLFDGSKVAPFSALQTFFDQDYPKGRRYHWRSTYLTGLDDDAIAALITLGKRRPSALSSLDLWVLGGAVAEVGISDTPLAHRTAPFLVGIESNWLDPAGDAENIAWARAVQATMAPHSTGGSYLNFDDPTDNARVAAVYGANYRRLQEIKKRYDPDNLFRMGPRGSR